MPVALLPLDQLLLDQVAAQPFGNAVAVCIQLDVDLATLVQLVAFVRLDACVVGIQPKLGQRLAVIPRIVARLTYVGQVVTLFLKLELPARVDVRNHRRLVAPACIGVHTDFVRRTGGNLHRHSLVFFLQVYRERRNSGRLRHRLPVWPELLRHGLRLFLLRLAVKLPALLLQHHHLFLRDAGIGGLNILELLLSPHFDEADLLDQRILEPVIHDAYTVVLGVEQVVHVRRGELCDRLRTGAARLEFHRFIIRNERLHDLREHCLNGIGNVRGHEVAAIINLRLRKLASGFSVVVLQVAQPQLGNLRARATHAVVQRVATSKLDIVVRQLVVLD
jgi:hypothetical protein